MKKKLLKETGIGVAVGVDNEHEVNKHKHVEEQNECCVALWLHGCEVRSRMYPSCVFSVLLPSVQFLCFLHLTEFS